MASVEYREQEILDEVRTWEPERRLALARRILEMPPGVVSKPPRRLPLDQVFGMLKTDRPAPSDEECRRIIEEERL
jgi:hypothetical protein